MDESDSPELDLRDEMAATGVNGAPPGEIDLTDRLRFAACALAADFGDRLPAQLAEALVFSSAQGLLVSASVTEFVPILAERRARQAIRAGAAAGPRPARAAWSPSSLPIANGPAAPTARPAGPPVPAAPAPPLAAPVEPLFALPENQLVRLRVEVERAQMRLADWKAGLEPAP
ncbi:MAG: hypothetical protein QOD57_34 [Actinomycetota bacterium]|nr:hypothetical protein [Actinomycetota bacterium]